MKRRDVNKRFSEGPTPKPQPPFHSPIQKTDKASLIEGIRNKFIAEKEKKTTNNKCKRAHDSITFLKKTIIVVAKKIDMSKTIQERHDLRKHANLMPIQTLFSLQVPASCISISSKSHVLKASFKNYLLTDEHSQNSRRNEWAFKFQFSEGQIVNSSFVQSLQSHYTNDTDVLFEDVVAKGHGFFYLPSDRANVRRSSSSKLEGFQIVECEISPFSTLILTYIDLLKNFFYLISI